MEGEVDFNRKRLKHMLDELMTYDRICSSFFSYLTCKLIIDQNKKLSLSRSFKQWLPINVITFRPLLSYSTKK